jgi:choice-of-anchor C domain-containing protein
MKRSHVVLILCLLAAAGVWLFWQHGSRLAPDATLNKSSANASGNGSAAAKNAGTNGDGGVAATKAAATTLPTLNTNKLAFRLANTTNSIRQLETAPHAILLANAFIDTDRPLDLKIPAHLKSAGDPGAYIVQARSAVDARFRAALAQVEAQIVSYIPNNAYLVRVTAGGAGALQTSPLVQAVLPYEPYYKLQSSLLGIAVGQQALPPGTALNLGMFAADAATAEQGIEKLGAKIIGRDRSAFGPVLRVLAPADWTLLAQSPLVQFIEPAHARVQANDLARVTAGITPDTLVGITNNYLGLTGKNVLVAVDDTGIDATHPDLLSRVLGLNLIDLVDTNGHGTHVAGIIASSGVNSMKPPGPTDVGANAQGSITNADFRGKAPEATLFSLNQGYSDYLLQTTAAFTNALISNNSWTYGTAEYDLAAASYDAATRDAMPGTTGSQPVLFVFAAGNSGGGNSSGAQGSGDTILSPGTAKNVITVGALEQLRNITNIVTDAKSNKSAFWQPHTDSASQVAWDSSRGNVGIGTEGSFGRFKPDVVSPGNFVVSTRSSQWATNTYYNQTNVLGTDYPFQLVDTNGSGLVYYNVAIPPNAVGVTISISPNRLSPNPFPTNLPIYARQASFPTTNSGGYDILTWKNGLAIPPDSGPPITDIQAIQGNGFSFAVGNTNNYPINYDLSVRIFTTNNLGDLEIVLMGMNEKLAPYYRYESGTSMAAADVSGVLALIQDYFTNQLSLTPSPALMKALLINGCRSVGNYGLAITNGINFQGWGLDNIQSCVPTGGLTHAVGVLGSSYFVDQNPTSGLATGDRHTYIMTMNPDPNTFGQYLPLQATLVWTDPPGDPAAAIKLVNNLDLIITNLDTGEVYLGNDISPDIGYNEPWDTNTPPRFDTVNNVENILLPPLLAGSYSVTVLGRAVNVNAVTAQLLDPVTGLYAPNVVQDYALVISVGEGEVTNAFTVAAPTISENPTGDQNITVVTTTNSPLFNQFVGASSPLLGTGTLPLGTNTVWGPNGVVTIGQTNQWHFYIVTNTGPRADYTNAAFITFDAVTLSIPRMGVYETTVGNATRTEADIDLYVTQDSSLTNLSPVTISNCLFAVGNSGASLGQGGTEFVFFTNSAPGQVYYVGVKSEDRMGSEYAFMPIFTDIPFSQLDQNGNQVVHGLLLPENIPDGNNAHPGVTNVFALAILPMIVEKVTVTNLNEHQNFGDLFGSLTFSSKHVVLNNHDGFGNTYGTLPRVYDDSRNPALGTTKTDGPGTLVDFRAKSALGPWILTEMDNSLTMTGQITRFDLVIQPHRNLKQPGVIVSVPPGGWFIDYVDVGAGYTNLTFYATNVTTVVAAPPIQMYEKLNNDPTLTDYDQEATLTNGLPPGNSISIGPPLAQGRYFIGLYNPNTTTAQNVFLSATLGIDASVNDVFNYSAGSGQTLADDAVTPVPPLPSLGAPGSYIFVAPTQLVASVNVGLVVQSPRISDYTFTLVSPTGQRVLLMENRGAGDTNGAGLVFVYTNVLNSTATGGAAANTNYLAVDPRGGTVPITYNFYTVPDEMTVYQGTNNFGPGNLLFDTGFTNNLSGPVTINVIYPAGINAITIIMNQFGNPFATFGDAWIYTAGAAVTNYEYLVFTDNTNLATVPIKFAPPPYNFTGLSSNYALSDFNQVTNGDYLAPTNIYDAFGGWTVPTNLVTYSTIVTNGQFAVVTNVVNLTNNLVSVVTDPSSSLTGDAGNSNYLALANGTITRSIATVKGRIYNATFWYRGPGIESWWRGEGNASDSSDPENNGNNGTLIGRFNFPAGEVGQAFQFEDQGDTYQFAGTNTYVQVPASASLNVGAGGGFTIEGWINPTNLARPQPLVEWLARVPTNTAVTNITIVQGPVLDPATGHYYYLLSPTNWGAAEYWAVQLGGHLVTLETANEGQWVYDTFTAYATLNRNLWTGLSDRSRPGTFVWSSGSANVPYTNWMAGQPTNCSGADHFVAILGPTNAYPGLWKLYSNLGQTCGETNQMFGVVEVNEIPTNGVQFWISGTNGTPGDANILQGCLYANIVDTNYVSHQIFSAAGLLQSNVYQHVAVTYNTNSGIAALYLNGTNVATTNLGVFMPKTDGDVLIGWDMSRYTNNYYGGKMDEMSVYSRAMSHAEISAIYQVTASANNGLTGKFDPTITPAVGLAEALVTFGASSNVIFGVNDRWSVNSFTFTAESNSMPLTISGMEPGILLDSFAISEAPLTNLYYFPEQALESLNGNSAYGYWTMQVWDNRVGAYLTNVAQLINWQLSFVLDSNAVVSASLPPQTPVTTTVPAGQFVYYSVTVPEWAHFATNILVSSSLPVNLWFNQTNPPTGANPNDFSQLNNVTSGNGFPTLGINAPLPPGPPLLPLIPGSTYYLGVKNNGTHSATVTLEVDYDIVALTNGVPFTSVLNTNEYKTVRYFQFDVSSNAYEATFELLKLSGNADLVLQKGVPLPTLAGADYGSFNVNKLDENLYVLTNSEPVKLSAGRWYLGVFKRDSGLITNSVLVKELDLTNGVPAVIDLANGVPFNFTAGPGAALTNFFRFHATNGIVSGTNVYLQGLRFELYNLSGCADLTVQTNAFPLAPPFFQSSQNSGREPELIFIGTNSVLTNLAADWYLGVPNKEVTNINFTIIAEIVTNLYFPAFPDAQGAGRSAQGGRYGDVYHVTTTSDSGPGSLRAAVNATNRTVVFDIAGTITLASPLIIANSYLTIAGQSSPGGGITVAGDMTTVQSAHDVIIRDVRFRPGNVVANANTNGLNIDGSFENPPGRLGGVYSAGQTFGGWTVVSGDVNDVLAAGWQPADGTTSLDLNGNTTGVISRNVPTVPGQAYNLRFAYAGNYGGGPNPKTMQVSWGGKVIGMVSFDTTGHSAANMGWVYTNLTVVGTGNDVLQFASTVSSQFGPTLDAVSLIPIVATNAYPGDSLQFLNASNVIADHISASWSSNNLVSVLNSSNVTVQWSIMADGYYDTNNPHGLGSLLRQGGGTLSFHHNLYADNYSGSPRLGDNLTLDFVNNVIYNWGIRSGLTGGTNDFDYSVTGCTNELNYVCNYLIAGPDTAKFAPNNYNITNIAFFGGVTNSSAANWIFQTNNFMDSDTNRVLNGANTSWGMFTNHYTRFDRAFPTPPVPTDEAFIAYERVLDFAGVNLTQRDALDTNIVTKVRYQTNLPFASTSASGLVAWWKAENNYLDSVGANHGAPVNGAGFTLGEVGTAFNFNGVNQYVLAQATPSLDVGLGSGFTIEGWVNPTSLVGMRPVTEFERVLGTANNANVACDFYVSLTGNPGMLYANIVDTGVTYHSFNSPAGTVTTGVWQHIALTYNKATGSGTLYRNGIVVAQQNLGSFIPQTSFTNFLIGARTTYGSAASPSDIYAGAIDELSVYNRALSTSEIAAIYAAGTAGKFAQTPSPLTFLDTDQDGIPDFWEDTFTTNLVFTPSNNNDRDGNGYTDLEEYNNWLAVPHALTTVTNPVGVDLYQICGQSGHLTFMVTNGVHGLVYLTNVWGSVTNIGTYSNSFAIFTPTNNAPTNYFGYAAFDFYVTNRDTAAYFGPVTVSVVVSAVPILTNPPLNVIEMTNGVPYTNFCNTAGSDSYHVYVPANAYGALFELDNRSGPMALVVRYGLPLPSLSSYDYYTNAPVPPANEQIAVLTNSTPVALAPGDWYFAAVNISGSSACLSYSAKVTLLASLVPPQFLFPTNTTTNSILETVATTISCLATDLDTPPLPLSFAIVNGPAGLTITNGLIYWTPSEAQGPSTNSVLVSVSNGAFSVTNRFTINVLESNLPPRFVWTNIPNQVLIVPGVLVLTNSAIDSDIPVNPLTYTLLTAPANAAISTNGVIIWASTNGVAGSNYLFTTVVTDTNPWAVNQKSFSITNAFSVYVVPGLPPGPQTNVINSNSITWFAVVVPTNAIYATNILLFATLPVNIWFSTNVPPTNNYELMANRTNGISVLSTNLATAPTNIVPGGIYFLGVQNLNSLSVTGAIEVDFALAYPLTLPAIPDQVVTAGDTLVVTNTATDSNAGATLVYNLSGSGASAGGTINANGIITWTTTTNIAPTNVVFTTIVTDTTAGVSATNTFNVIVLPGLIDDNPQTNIVVANSIKWFTVKVPVNADFATNYLLFATAPVNFWFSTNVPPSITSAADVEFLHNSTGGLRVMDTVSAPRLVPGSRYFLGVQNTNSFAVTDAVKVKFHLLTLTTSFSIFSITQTNFAGSNGFLVAWFAPTNTQFHLQWTPALVPPNWNNFNGVISFASFITATNSKFQYFDDGSQTGGFGPTRFYRLLLLNSPTNTPPFFLNAPGMLNASPLIPFVFTNSAKDWDVPAQTLTYAVTNSLIGTNLVTINPAGVITWTPTAAQNGMTNLITTAVTDSGVPAQSVTNSFTIVVVAAPPAFSSITAGTNGVTFRWTALTNEQFQVQWTTNLVPINWHLFPNIITSVTGNFSFTDTNTPLLLMKFYQLILLP